MRSEYEQNRQTCQGDFSLLERGTLSYFCQNEFGGVLLGEESLHSSRRGSRAPLHFDGIDRHLGAIAQMTRDQRHRSGNKSVD